MDEEKKVDETTSASDETSAQNEQESSNESAQGEKTDFYKQELEKLTGQLKQAEHTIVDLKKDKKEERSGLTEEDVKRLVKEQTADLHRNITRSTVEDRIRQRARTTSEADLAIAHYNNTLHPTGVIDEDVERALALANYKRVQAEHNEAARSAAREHGEAPAQAGQRKQEVKSTAPALSPEERKALEWRGLTKWDDKLQQWVRP